MSAILSVGRTSFRIAPSAGIARIIDSFMQALLPILTTYLAAQTTTALVDAYAGKTGASDHAILLVFLTAGVGLVMLVWQSISNYISKSTKYKIEAAIEDDMIRHFTALPFEAYDDKDKVDMFDKARRFSGFFSYIFDTIGQIATALIGGIGAVVALFAVSPWIAFAVLVAIIPGIFIQLNLARKQASHWGKNITNRRRQGNLNWMLLESRFIAEMRVYGVVNSMIKMHAKLRDEDKKERLDLELRTSWKELAANIIESLVQLGSLVWITLEIIHHAQPVGQFLYIQQMVGRALGQAASLARQLGQIDEDLANIVDYRSFMDLELIDTSGHELRSTPQTIRLDNLTFMYPKTDIKVLDKVSLEIKAGQHIAIVGENGAGKSTLIKLITGLYQPTEGDILLDDAPLSSVRLSSWHKQIGLLMQDFVKYYFATIGENIAFGDVNKKPTESNIKTALKKSELDKVVAGLKYQRDTFIERWMASDDDQATATELSGGQEQRLALARNFYRDSPIIILDEPTSAIDALAEDRIFNELFSSKKTIIAISHRLSTIEKADAIYMMKDGRVVETGTMGQLIEKRGEFYRMFKSQIK